MTTPTSSGFAQPQEEIVRNRSIAVAVVTAGAFLSCGIATPAAAFNLNVSRPTLPTVNVKPSVPAVRGNVAGAPSGNPGGSGGSGGIIGTGAANNRSGSTAVYTGAQNNGSVSTGRSSSAVTNGATSSAFNRGNPGPWSQSGVTGGATSSVFKGGNSGVTGGATSPVSNGGEKIANSPYKSTTATFVTEDDAQNGPDHVDTHRSTGYVRPYVSPPSGTGGTARSASGATSPVSKGGNGGAGGSGGSKIGLSKKGHAPH